MSLVSAKSNRGRWDVYRERPFWRLVELFVARVFRGGGDSDAPGLDLGMGLILTLLAIPGGFVSLFLFDKYATLLQWLRGANFVDPLLVSLPDEYFFIVLSMTVSGAVAVWRWDAIFPDRRDYMNLVHLPISTRTIFLANLTAVLFLAVLVAVDVNAASCILFPTVVAATQSQFVFFLQFAAIHALAVLLASMFSFLLVFSLLGLSMALLPARAFKKASSYIRAWQSSISLPCSVPASRCQTCCAACAALRRSGPFCCLPRGSSGMCQSLRGRATPALTTLGHLTFPAVIAVCVVALCAYAIGYRRHFLRIAELSEAMSAGAPSHLSSALRLPRSPGAPHCISESGIPLCLENALAQRGPPPASDRDWRFGLVLASQALMNAVETTRSARQAALSTEALSIPFILSFLIIVGLRAVFEIPAELPSNWIFRLMLDPDHQECESLARTVILLAVFSVGAPRSFSALSANHRALNGSDAHILGTGLVAAADNALLIRFRKLPFTCTRPIFQQHSIVVLISAGFGFLLYAASLPEFESYALLHPATFRCDVARRLHHLVRPPPSREIRHRGGKTAHIRGRFFDFL